MDLVIDSLEQFFGGYFHQDCFVDDPSWEAVVGHYKADAGANDRVALAQRIEVELIGSGASEDELGERLAMLGSYYRPQGEGFTNRQWLIAVVKRLVE
ncbi:MAG: contact-dependent growth inhibition system immunity protein [Flavobacteriales bacterium]